MHGTLTMMETTPSPPEPSKSLRWTPQPMPDVSDTEVPAPRHVKDRPRLRDMAGKVVRDRFELVRDLGAGISGRVYLATDRELFGREVAIKVLCRREDYIERRFITEAEVLSNVEHPNLVRAIAFGRTDQEYLFMALEYVPGLTLEKHLMRRKWLPWREVVEIGIQLANVLQALHDAGVVHRDVTPYNIVLMDTPKGPRPKLIDLGVAYLNDEFRAAQEAVFSDLPQRHPTQAGFAVGSPKYRPEDAAAYPKDPSLDVWGLAVTLYQLCTGARPDETGRRAIPDVVPDNDAPEFLSRLLLSAVTPDRADRLTSALELERGLAAVRDAHPEQPPAHLFDGCFDRIELLGKGSCAVAYRANDRNLSRECVVKILRADNASRDNVIRFRRSAKILSALSHEVIPRVYYYGIADGQPFMAMERCPGVSAAEFVTGRQLDASEIVEIGIQLAGALGECHEAGVLYRDLCPPNVLIQRGRAPRAFLFDFDAALVLPHMYARLTERWGTPPEERLEPSKDIDLRGKDYVGPEIRAGADFTPANDVYALGLLLYRFLTGKRPCFPGDTEIVRPREQIDDCPDTLDDLLSRMLNAAPGARPSIPEVVRLLKEAALEIRGEIPEAADPPVTLAATVTSGHSLIAEPAPVSAPVEPAAVVSPEPTLVVALERAPVMASEPAPAIAPAVGSVPAAVPASVRRRSAAFAAAGVLVVAAIGVLASMLAAPFRVTPEDSQPAFKRGSSEGSERPALASAVPSMAPVAPEARDGTPAAPSVPPAESTAVTGQQAKARPKKSKGAADPVLPATVGSAADQARGTLRQNCAGAPASFTVEVVASGGRGSVRSINGLPPAGEGWQACARRELERVPYPASAPSSPVRLRLQLQAQPGQGTSAERQ